MHDPLLHWSRWAFLPWAQKPQMRQAFTAVPSACLFQRASQKVPELSRTVVQVSKKRTTQLEAALASYRAQGFLPLPEGRRCHGGPCSYHTCHSIEFRDCGFNSFLNLIDGLVQGCSLSQRCDSHYDIAYIVRGLHVSMYCLSQFGSFFAVQCSAVSQSRRDVG